MRDMVSTKGEHGNEQVAVGGGFRLRTEAGVVLVSESVSLPVSFLFSSSGTDAEDAPGRETYTDVVGVGAASIVGVTFSS